MITEIRMDGWIDKHSVEEEFILLSKYLVRRYGLYFFLLFVCFCIACVFFLFPDQLWLLFCGRDASAQGFFSQHRWVWNLIWLCYETLWWVMISQQLLPCVIFKNKKTHHKWQRHWLSGHHSYSANLRTTGNNHLFYIVLYQHVVLRTWKSLNNELIIAGLHKNIWPQPIR